MGDARGVMRERRWKYGYQVTRSCQHQGKGLNIHGMCAGCSGFYHLKMNGGRGGQGGSQPGLETGLRRIPAWRPQPDSSVKGEGQLANGKNGKKRVKREEGVCVYVIMCVGGWV